MFSLTSLDLTETQMLVDAIRIKEGTLIKVKTTCCSFLTFSIFLKFFFKVKLIAGRYGIKQYSFIIYNFSSHPNAIILAAKRANYWIWLHQIMFNIKI